MRIVALNITPSYKLIAAQGRNGGGIALLIHPSVEVHEKGFLVNGSLRQQDFTLGYTPLKKGHEEVQRDIEDAIRGLSNKVAEAELRMLSDLPSKLEIRETLFGLRRDRAPGLDGANADCLQQIWNL
ncbi:hypothetical protein R1sor_004587 [Riccia sorocarpa]|uniref:Uncharacterized protein n=1 Tax=Riccia sorocarpa TaxID=122646 RepID=A0ABD3HJB7_9MARC